MDEEVEDKLLLMANHFRKLNRYLKNVDLQTKPIGKVKVF